MNLQHCSLINFPTSSPVIVIPSASPRRPDHADLRSCPEVAKLLAKHGEPPIVLFSEEVLKINRRGEAVPRVLLVACNSIYLLNAETHRKATAPPLLVNPPARTPSSYQVT